jgi:Family of unknown function (DUF5926)
MGKSSRRRQQQRLTGRPRPATAPSFVARPFAGLPGEPDWVAMREVVPAATAVVRLAEQFRRPAEDGRPPVEDVTVATVLPLAWPALRRSDGAVYVGLQTAGGSGDPSRDVAAALLSALDGEPGAPVQPGGPPGEGPRLQDVLDRTSPMTVQVHEGFDFWVDDVQALDEQSRESLERANASAVPTERLTSVEAAYWCRIGDRVHLRWALPHDEDALLDAIARLHAAGRSGLGEGSRYIGAFRALGLLVPVWDLPPDCTAADVEEPAAAFADRLAEALQRSGPLDYEERRARAGVVSRQLTLR